MLDKNKLPGMLALELAVKENKWPHTMDAQVWTKEWLKTISSKPEIPNDEGMMISWFANAIMAGYDAAMSKMKDNVERLNKEKEELKIINEIQKQINDRNNLRDEIFERDPYNLSPHTPGAKLDANKPDCDLVFSNFSNALLEVAKVGTAGAIKYTDNGWESVPDGIRRYRSAIYRHLLSSKFLDDDSGMPHMAHAAWNCLAVLELLLRTENNNTDI